MASVATTTSTQHILSSGNKIEDIVQNIKCLQDGQSVGGFPHEVSIWQDFLNSPVVNCLSVGILRLDCDFKITYFNSSYGNYIEKYNNITPSDCMGKVYFECFPEAGNSVTENFLSVKSNGKQLNAYESQLPADSRNITNTSYWNANIVPIMNKMMPAGFLLLAHDITDKFLKNYFFNIINQQNHEIEQLKTTIDTLVKLKQQISRDYEKNMITNSRSVLLPLLDKLRLNLENTDNMPYVDGIGFALDNLTTDFHQTLGLNEYGLTPREVQISTMISTGKTTKEIAACFNISTDSIDSHRKSIRTKLGLKNSKINLQTALSSMYTKTDISRY